MYSHFRRILSCVLCLTVLVGTCLMGGLMLPVGATAANLIVGGDFESTDGIYTSTDSHWGTIFGNSNVEIVVDPDDPTETNHVLKLPANKATGSLWYQNMTGIAAGKTYRISGKFKGQPSKGALTIGDSKHAAAGVVATANFTSSEWVEFSYNLTLNTTLLSNDKNYIFAVKNKSTTVDGYYDDLCVIEVPELTGIALAESAITLESGKTATLTVLPQPEEADVTAVTWSSSNTEVATVSNGTVTAVAAGTATITADAGNGMTATCTVTVRFANLIVGGDFESDGIYNGTDTHWQKICADGKATVVMDPDDSSNHILQIPTGMTDPNKSTYYRLTGSKADTVYRLTGRAKVNGSSKVINLVTTYVSTGSGWKTLTGNGEDWVNFEYIFTTKNDSKSGTFNNNFVFALCNTAESPVYVDDLEIRQVPPIEGITLSETQLKLPAGDAATLTANVVPADAAAATVTWESSDPSVATVANGTVTAVTPGEAVITADAGNGITATCAVTVGFANLVKGGDFESTAGIYTSTDTNWKTVFGNSAVEIVVDPDDPTETNHVLKLPAGKATGSLWYQNMTGIAAGKTYRISGKFKGEVGKGALTVGDSSHAAQGVVSQAAYTSAAWAEFSYDLTLKTPLGSNDKSYIFALKNKSTTVDGYYDDLCVMEVPVLSGLTMSQTEATVTEGETVTLTVSAQPYGVEMPAITWSSSDDTVATVQDGVVTAIKGGTVTITARASDTIAATCEVTVDPLYHPDLESIALSNTAVTLYPTDTATLTVTAAPEEAEMPTIVWTSDANTVATVENGVITAVSAGTATVTADAGNGIQATCTVTVQPFPALTGLQITSASRTVSKGQSIVLAVQPVPERAQLPALTWHSNAPSVATVVNGTVTGVKAGDAVITVSAGSVQASCAIHVVTTPDLINGGDFESDGIYNGNDTHWKKICADGKATVVVDPDNSANHILMIPVGMTSADANQYWSFSAIRPDTSYRVTCRVKLDGTAQVVHLFSAYVVAPNGWRKVTGNGGWTEFEFVFTTKADSVNVNYILALGNSGSTPVYLDDLSVCEVPAAKSVSLSESYADLTVGDQKKLTATVLPAEAAATVSWESSNPAVVTVENGTVTAIGAGRATVTARVGNQLTASCLFTVRSADPSVDTFTAEAETVPSGTLQLLAGDTEQDKISGISPDHIVTVNATPEPGYLMVPGSLVYVEEDGHEQRILNKASGNFGEGDGTEFMFKMPVNNATVRAEFVPITQQSFQMATIGTSIFYSDAMDILGVRFLTRLYIAGLDVTADTMTVKYNGKDYTVKEIGSLLKRTSNNRELVLDNYNENDVNGSTRLWRAVAFDGASLEVVDYTEQYLDCTVVMRTELPSNDFNERLYQIRGYIVLDDGTPDGLVVYSNLFGDSVNHARERLENYGRSASETKAIQLLSPAADITVDLVTDPVKQYLTIENNNDADAAQFWGSGKYAGNDYAPVVNITWEENGSDEYQVIWADNPALQNAAVAVTEGTQYTLTCLIPGTTYYWKVRTADGSESPLCRLTTSDETTLRWINTEGAANIRDLGGWTTESGKRVRYELLYRGSCLDARSGVAPLTEDDIDLLVNRLGIQLEIDLRGNDDGDNGLQNASDIGVDYLKATLANFDQSFTATYKANIGKIFAAMADEANYPMYFHCVNGADRTGTLAFLVEGLLGVSLEDMTRDFELTSFSSRGNRLRSKLIDNGGVYSWEDGGVFTTDGNYVAWGPLYTKMLSNYGTGDGKLSSAIENFLKTDCGVTAQQIQAIRDLLLED